MQSMILTIALEYGAILILTQKNNMLSQSLEL